MIMRQKNWSLEGGLVHLFGGRALGRHGFVGAGAARRGLRGVGADAGAAGRLGRAVVEDCRGLLTAADGC